MSRVSPIPPKVLASLVRRAVIGDGCVATDKSDPPVFEFAAPGNMVVTIIGNDEYAIGYQMRNPARHRKITDELKRRAS